MYSQVDSEGKQYRYFVAIINHRKNTKAVDKVDQFRTHYGKKTTTGWNLEVEWKDGTTSWLPLKEIKETNPVEVANYAISNQIDTEPALDWWVHDILHKQKRLIKLSQKRAVRTGYKFGLRVPDNVSEAIELDRISGYTLWHDAIMKEMTNVRVAFELKEEGSAPPAH